jgi:lytic cellulose monooxygenase (C4-dehydrogenating)
MHCHEHVNEGMERRSWLLRAMAVVTTSLLFLIPWAGDTASAHGSTVDPMSRNYGCWFRWGDDFQNPDMETQDPMCYQAWQANTNAMWNWNGLYQENVQGNHQAAVPDGSLCSGGHTGDGTYDALDTPGDWIATDIADSGSFSVDVWDQANHGAKYFLVYVTKQGFDPTTQKLTWDDLELVKETDAYAPGSGTANPEGGYNYALDVSAPGRSGHHLVYTIWEAGHADQVYYWCADVNFG